MKHVKYFSKRPADNSVKQFSSRNGYVRRFSAAKGEISLSSIDPDKYYLYKDSNVTLPGFAIDQGSYIISSSRYSRGYKLAKAYGPFDTAADAETYANESGVNLIDTTAPVEEPAQPEVAEMSGNDEKLTELESKVDNLTELVTKLTEKFSEVESSDAKATEEEVTEEKPEEEVTEEVTEEPVAEESETSAEEPQEDTPVAEESSEEICPNCGCDPCICEEDSADNGVTEEDVGLGEQVPANTGNEDNLYTQVPEEDILAQFSNSNKPEPEKVAAMSSASDSMFSVLFR